jgi:hypothetical protein
MKKKKIATVPHKYYSIDDETCLLIGVAPPGNPEPTLLERRWTILRKGGSVISGHRMAGRYFINGEVGAEEITAEEADEFAARLAGSLKKAVER